MKKYLLTLSIVAFTFLPARADSTPANPSALEDNPWEKIGVSVGAFVSNTESGVRVGSGIGLDVDVEDVLGLDANTTVVRAETFWRFSNNRKHRLDLSWFALRRSATRTVGEPFDIQDDAGNIVTIQAGSQISSKFNLDIIQTAYSYSFQQDDRVDLAVVGGLYVMPINFELTATGATNASGDLKFTAPLPVAGLRLDVALTPKWFLRTGSQFFYVEYENFTGHLMQTRAAVEFVPISNLGIGVGVDSMRFAVEAASDDYPGADFRGNVDFRYTGLQVYGKLRI